MRTLIQIAVQLVEEVGALCTRGKGHQPNLPFVGVSCRGGLGIKQPPHSHGSALLIVVLWSALALHVVKAGYSQIT